MRVRRSIAPSLRAIAAHKVRASLALASVSVGVAAVVLTSAIGTGATREVVRQMESMGTNLLVVRPAQVKKLAARKTIRGMVTTLAIEDYQAIAELDLVAKAIPGVEGGLRVKAGTFAAGTTVRGTTEAFPALRGFRLRVGRFFDAGDDDAARRVAVLGARVGETLFPGENPVGREMRIRGVPFEVIGLFEPKGVLADGSDEDNQVLIPIRTALRRVFNVRWLSAVFVGVRDPQRMETAETEIGRLLRVRHRLSRDGSPDDFAIQNTTRFLAIQKQTADSLMLLTTGLAALALLVGGIGILALMLLSVKERTGEIGLRMAVGAKPRDILIQFLFEATLLALGGWLAGITIGAIGAVAVAFSTTWTIGVPGEAVLASLAMAVTTGLGFGALPARKASLVPPIEALLAV